MTPKRIVEKITAFILSGMIALSSIAVGSITNTNKISAAQTNTKKTEASYDTSWYGKSYEEVVKLYGGNVQPYSDCVADQEDLQEAFSKIREDDADNILHVIPINEKATDIFTLTKALSVPSNTYILAYGTINFSTGKDSEGNQTQGRFTISGSKNVCIRGNAETKFVLSSDDTNAINILDGSNNINIVNTSFETKTNCYNSVFVRASDSSGLSFTSLKFKGNVKRAFSCSKIGNTKFTNNTISNLTIPNNESAIYISNIIEDSKNTFGSLTINNINSSSNNFGYGISIVNSYNTEINNAQIDGNKKTVGIRISGSTDVIANPDMAVYSGTTISNSTIKNCSGRGILISGAVKNINISKTGVLNTVPDENNKDEQFGIKFVPNYIQTKEVDGKDVPTRNYGLLSKNDYLAKISDCTSAEKNCNTDADTTTEICKGHLHNNGTGIYITGSKLDNNSSNRPYGNNIRVVVTNNRICCNDNYGIRTAYNLYDGNVIKFKVELSENSFLNNAKDRDGNGIDDIAKSEDDIDIRESVSKENDYYVGDTTGLKYSLTGGKNCSIIGYVKESDLSTAKGNPTKSFKIPSTIQYGSITYTVTEIAASSFVDCKAYDNDKASNYKDKTSEWNKVFGNGRIIIPSSVTKIGSRAFERASGIKSIYIGSYDSLNIEDFAFINCYDLTEFEVAKARKLKDTNSTNSYKTKFIKNFITKDGVLFNVSNQSEAESNTSHDYNGNLKLLSYPAKHSTHKNVKMYIHTLSSLGNKSLANYNSYLTNKEIYLYDKDTGECYYPEPNTKKTTSIYGGYYISFKDVPNYATNLSVHVGDLVYNNDKGLLRNSNGNIYSSITLNYISGANVYNFTYGNNSSLNNYVTDYSVPNVNQNEKYDITYITPQTSTGSATTNKLYVRNYNVTSFEYRSFYNCGNLEKLTLNKNLESFLYMKNGQDSTACAGPIDNCTNLKTIAVADGNEYFKVVEDTVLKTTSLYSKDFSKFYLLPPASGVKDFTLNSNVKSIANYAFAYNPTLEKVTCDGTKLYEIGVRAFYECDKFANFDWKEVPEYKGTQSNTTYSSLQSFLDYAFTNHIGEKGDYVPNNFIDGNNKDAKFRLGYSKMLLSNNLKVNGISNIFKSAVQRMYNPLYYGVLENVESKALEVKSNKLDKNFQDFMNGSVTDFTNSGNAFDSRWFDEEKKNATKSGTENYDSTNTEKANNTSILNKSAKWTNKDEMKNAEVNVDYAYGDNKTSYNFLFVLDKTGSMNEANSASRSKMYDQYSTVYNMSKAILSDKEADNKVGIINFSNTSNTDIMNGSNGDAAKIKSSSTDSKGNKTYTFDVDKDYMLTNNLDNIDKYLSNTETEGDTHYDVGMNATNSVLQKIKSNNRKTAVIFISDGAPTVGHEGIEAAKLVRTQNSDVPIYTILEFVADSDKASDKCKSAMGGISGYYYKDINDKHPSFNTYNKSGKDSNELTNAFKEIYENFTSTPKQVLQDTISQNFTTDSITLTRTVPQYDKINLAVDVNDTTKGGTDLYSRLNSNSINERELQLVVVNSNNDKVTLTPYKKIVAQNHIRYVFSNVPNEKDMTYYLTTSFGDISPVLEKATTTKFLSAGLLKLDYGIGSDTTSYKLMSTKTLLATHSGNIKVGSSNKENYSIPVPSKNITNYYYLKKNSDGSATVTKIEKVTSTSDFTQYYKDSLDGIVVKVYKDNNEQVHIRVFLNDIQCLVKYSLNFGLTLKSNYQKIYGKSFETNDTDGNTDNECFVVDNNDEALTPTDDFNNFTKTSETTKVINKVPTPKLLRQKYGNITVYVRKEYFDGKKYSLKSNNDKLFKEDSTVSLSEYKNQSNKIVKVIDKNNLFVKYTYLPGYDTNGNRIEYLIKQLDVPKRYYAPTPQSSIYVNEKDATVYLDDHLRIGFINIKKNAFDNLIKDIWFNITDNDVYNENVVTNDRGYAYPSMKSGKTYLPVYNINNEIIDYTVTELGIKDNNGNYYIPKKYKPKIISITKNLNNSLNSAHFDFDNLSRDDFTTEIKNVDKNYYGETKDNGEKFECVDITNGVPVNKKPVNTNTEGKVYENQIGSFDVTFKNKVADTKSALCEILIDGKSVYSQKLSFNNNGEKTVRVIYDYKWNIDPRKVIARINYNNRNDEVVTSDNVATTTLQPKEWLDFSVKIDGLYTDSKCTNKLPVNKTDGKYYYANKGQQFYIKATFTNKNKGRAYNPPIDVLYSDDIYLEHYFLAEDIPANGSQTGVIEVTADTDLCVKDLAVRINWTGRGSEATPNDNEDKVTVEVRKVLDLSIEPVKANVPYYNDYDVVTSVMVYNKTTTEAVLPDDHVKVTFKAFVGEQAGIGVLCYQEQKEVVIPTCKKGEPFASNLVYFKWHVPKEKKTSYIYWIATINEDKKLFEADYSDNTTNISEGRPSLEKKNDDGTPYIVTNLDCLVSREDYVTKNTPSTKYEETSEDGYVEKNIGKTFDYITPKDTGLNNYNNQAVWSEWSFDSTNNKFIKHTYGQTIGKFNISDFTTASLKSTAKLSKNSSHSETIITPDKNSPTVERDDNGNWTMRSGYGFSLKYNPRISSFYAENGVYNSNFDSLTEEEKADKLSNATTGIQMASAYYPEFMYMDKKFTDDNGNTQYTCNTLERNVLSTNLFNFNLPMNDQSASILTNHKEDSRIHFIPIWYKNGDYNISIVASYSWTPAGAISTCDNSTNINIDGSMYDDWYLTGDAH